MTNEFWLVFPQVKEDHYLSCRKTTLVLTEGELFKLQGRRSHFEKILGNTIPNLPQDVGVSILNSDEELRVMSGRYGPIQSKRAQRRSREVNTHLKGQNMKVQQYRADKTLLHSPGVSL